MQGVWRASVPGSQPQPIVKPLYPDAGSGIVFNLGEEVLIGSKILPRGVIMLPVNKVTQFITLSPGSLIAGIRMHPAMGYAVFGRRYCEPTHIPRNEACYRHLYKIFDALMQQANNSDHHVDTLIDWSRQHMDVSRLMPVSMQKILDGITHVEKLAGLDQYVGLSQRQVERLCNTWLGMTPKYFQRILRVKEAILFLRKNNNNDLANVAINFGFSDQAHMTREFRHIACTTPRAI